MIYYIVKKEKENIYYDQTKPRNFKNLKTFLNEKCLSNGSTLEGRMKSFNFILNTRQKPCILISDIKAELLIPLNSIKSKNNILINYYSIKSVSGEGNITEIEFINNKKEIFDFNKRIILKQIKRCDLFLKKIRIS